MVVITTVKMMISIMMIMAIMTMMLTLMGLVPASLRCLKHQTVNVDMMVMMMMMMMTAAGYGQAIPFIST